MSKSRGCRIHSLFVSFGSLIRHLCGRYIANEFGGLQGIAQAFESLTHARIIAMSLIRGPLLIIECIKFPQNPDSNRPTTGQWRLLTNDDIRWEKQRRWVDKR